MIHRFLTLTAFALCFFMPANGNAFDITSFTGSLAKAILSGAKEQICKQGGVCRKFKGIPCEFSKDLISSCAVICADRPDFLASTCMKKAKSKFGLDASSLKYKTGEHVAAHLKRQLEKGKAGNNSAQVKLFDAFCSVKAENLVLPQYKEDISDGCRKFKSGR